MDRKDYSTEYELYDGLFGQTDRNSGEYHFKSGSTEQIYSNASYIPIDQNTVPPRYYRPNHTEQPVKNKRKEKKLNGAVIIAMLCLCCALIGGLTGAIIMNSLNTKSNSHDVSKDVVYTSTSESVTAEESSEISTIPTKSLVADSSSESTLSAKDVYALSCPQVVSINTEKYTTGRNGEKIPNNISGTGFFVSEDGYILTNYHVVEEAYYYNYPVIVTANDGTEYNAVVVGYDTDNDIALIKVNSYSCNAASFGDSDGIEVGEDIFIIGNPYGILDFTFTTGHVGGPIRKVDAADNGIPIEMFQLDADIYEGNSGGPVYNDKGRVIGIVTAKFSNNANDGIGFAIPINNAKGVISDLISTGYISNKASLGVDYLENYNSLMANYFGLPTGAYIKNVRPGSCAEKAGLKGGDIIVQIGNESVHDMSECENLVRQYSSGDSAIVVVFRDDDNDYKYLSVTFDVATS